MIALFLGNHHSWFDVVKQNWLEVPNHGLSCTFTQ